MALLLGIGLVLTLFVSSAFIALEADHDCVGEHCDICGHIEECRALLHSIGLLVFMLLISLVMLPGGHGKHVADGIRLPVRASLVSWKVRLNN